MKNDSRNNIDKFKDLAKDARVCMLIFHEGLTGNFSGRPMGMNKIDEDGTIWFFTKKSSHKVDELEDNKSLALSITDNDNGIYLMVNGTGSLSVNKEKMKELWNPINKAWFPEGLDDPDLILIKVIPTEVNYWDSSSSKMVVIFNMIKAIVTGEEYNEGEQGHIAL